MKFYYLQEVLFAEKDNKQIRAPVIKLDDNQVAPAAQLKYLELIVDKKFHVTEYFNQIRRKAEEITNKIVQLTRKTYSRKGHFVRTVMERVVKPAMLYAYEIWGERARTTVNKKIMLAAQRPFLLATVKAYKTTPTVALQVLQMKHHRGGLRRVYTVTNTEGT